MVSVDRTEEWRKVVAKERRRAPADFPTETKLEASPPPRSAFEMGATSIHTSISSMARLVSRHVSAYMPPAPRRLRGRTKFSFSGRSRLSGGQGGKSTGEGYAPAVAAKLDAAVEAFTRECAAGVRGLREGVRSGVKGTGDELEPPSEDLIAHREAVVRILLERASTLGDAYDRMKKAADEARKTLVASGESLEGISGTPLAAEFDIVPPVVTAKFGAGIDSLGTRTATAQRTDKAAPSNKTNHNAPTPDPTGGKTKTKKQSDPNPNPDTETTKASSSPVPTGNQGNPAQPDHPIPPATENAVTEQEALQLENALLCEAHDTLAEKAREAEARVMEIGALSAVFASEVLHQAKELETLHGTAVASSELVRRGNEELRKGAEHGAGFRYFMLVFLVMASFSLLFLHWYT